MAIRPIATGLTLCDLVIVDEKRSRHNAAKLVIERLDTLEHTYERSVTLNFADTLQELMGIFRVCASYIPVHGVYHAMLIIDGEFIVQMRFSIIPKAAKP